MVKLSDKWRVLRESFSSSIRPARTSNDIRPDPIDEKRRALYLIIAILMESLSTMRKGAKILSDNNVLSAGGGANCVAVHILRLNK